MGKKETPQNFWHQRYLQQATWTGQARDYILKNFLPVGSQRVLEVGCGSGAVLSSTEFLGNPSRMGLDIDYDILRDARELCTPLPLLQGDSLALPFASEVFDLAFCHFLLLWVKHPLQAVREMRRVTRSGGLVAAFAEPDYAHRIDFPAHLAVFGQAQTQALTAQGADTTMGSKLPNLLSEAGLKDVSYGIIGGIWEKPPTVSTLDMEWQVLRHDLKNVLSERELMRFQQFDLQAWQKGERVLYVPTFYAWGIVPKKTSQVSGNL